MTTIAQTSPQAGLGSIRRSVAIMICGAIFLAACAPILLTPVLPTVDFYDHISRYYVLSHLADPFLAQNYQANWSLLPNIGLDVVATALLAGVPALMSAKVVALLIFATQYGGVLMFNRALTGRFSWVVALLAAGLLYSFIFTWGFANFLFGLGLVFWGAAAWLALRARLWLATLVGVLFALVIFLTHGVAFALYGLLLGGLELGTFLAARDRRPAQLAWRMAALALQAVIPAALFAISATVKAPDGVTNAGRSIQALAEQSMLMQRLLELAQHRLRTIVQVAEGPSLWFDVAAFGLTLAVLVALGLSGRLRVLRQAWVAIGIGAGLVAFTPPALFGVGYVSDRIPLFLALLAVGSLDIRLRAHRLDRVCVAVLAGLLVARLGGLIVEWRPYSADFDDYNAVVARMPSHQVVGYVNANLHFRNPPDRRCEMYGPLLVSLHGHASSLFAIPTAQPLKLAGPLYEAEREPVEHTAQSGRRAAEMQSAAVEQLVRQRRFQYVLICDAKNLARALPPEAEVAANQGRFTLLRLR